ncbi:hypothetical protein BpHYR1_052254 [Brachionus plicatilis]|uniref:Uncharacterized protein n=1 Tax=Brachionus plicatilis TaxID=10195 RepID=A0A3M7TAG7_BRAPC|nr:hypothetical protein BpHYR1_052254 [Brachionus plicatilis]
MIDWKFNDIYKDKKLILNFFNLIDLHHLKVSDVSQDQYICGTKDVSVATIYRTCFGPSAWAFLYFVFVFCTRINNAIKIVKQDLKFEPLEYSHEQFFLGPQHEFTMLCQKKPLLDIICLQSKNNHSTPLIIYPKCFVIYGSISNRIDGEND